MRLRPEEPHDFAAVRGLLLRAFAPSTLEAEIVDALRAAGDHVPELCLVALASDDAIAGHVMLSRAHVDQHRVLGLGPIAVEPSRQREGVGAALMEAVIERASSAGHPLIALLGHPAYYPRFGFVPAEASLGLEPQFDAPPEAWMALALPAYEPHIRGRFRYAGAFG